MVGPCLPKKRLEADFVASKQCRLKKRGYTSKDGFALSWLGTIMGAEKHFDTENESKKVAEDSSIDEDDSCESSRCTIDPVLLKLKIFFFLFFGGFGTTFPYLGIYFKQIGLSASSVGFLAGVRPLIQCASGPLWALLADRYKARKAVLLFSIIAWLVMTILLAYPKPHHEVCKAVNKTTKRIQSRGILQKTNFIPLSQGHIGSVPLKPGCFPFCRNEQRGRAKRSTSPKEDKSLIMNNFAGNDFFNTSKVYIRYLKDSRKNSSVSDRKSEESSSKERYKTEYTIERDPKELHDVFIILMTLIIVGEFLEAPTFIMIDTALLEHLGDKKTMYGRTRLFGSLGYGVASFGIGALLDRFHYQFCGKTMTNYTMLFYIFAGFMVLGFFFALFGVSFEYNQTDSKHSSAMDVLRVFGTLRHGSFLLIAWFLGFSHGGTMNFLNWYLEDLGATRFLMGIGTSCRAAAIVIGFLISNTVINKIGHFNMIFFALIAYTLSFFGYSFIRNPWYALPIETAQGICYSMSWSACITYLGAAAPPNGAATVQGMFDHRLLLSYV